jgi:hypothetical protein
MLIRTNTVLNRISDPKKQDDRDKQDPEKIEMIKNTYKFSLFVYPVNMVMSIFVGYAAYKSERTWLIVWLCYDAFYIPISVVNVLSMFDWGSATMVFNIYFWLLVFKLQRKLREAHHWKMVISQCNAQV